MHEKTRFLMALLIAVSIFLIVLVVAIYGSLKKTEAQFNERKAVLIKENLDLKDGAKAVEEALNQKKESLAILEKERKNTDDQIASFNEEKEALKKEYEEELLALKTENASLKTKIASSREKTLAEHIDEAIEKEDNDNLKKFLAKMKYNIEVIKKGGNIELEPIVVTDAGEGARVEPAQEKIPASQVSAREGKVMSVDGKYSLVVFDLGRKDGVKQGEQCSILKDGKEIASAEVISTRYNVSAGFVYETAYGYAIDDIKEGDGVAVF
jgi:hypothetical protein